MRINYTQRHAEMLRLHGAKDDEICGTCYWLECRKYTHTVYKCSKYLVTMSAATDWRKKWAACGMHYRDWVGEVAANA